MTNEWILDVLADLETFAKVNGLPALEQQLGATARVAVRELASHEELASGTAVQDIGHAGNVYRSATTGQNA